MVALQPGYPEPREIVRVRDTNRVSTNRLLDTVFVDEIRIRTDSDIVEPPTTPTL